MDLDELEALALAGTKVQRNSRRLRGSLFCGYYVPWVPDGHPWLTSGAAFSGFGRVNSARSACAVELF